MIARTVLWFGRLLALWVACLIGLVIVWLARRFDWIKRMVVGGAAGLLGVVGWVFSRTSVGWLLGCLPAWLLRQVVGWLAGWLVRCSLDWPVGFLDVG